MQTRGERTWYAAFTKPRNEEAAKFFLSIKGIEVFHPKLFIPGASRKHVIVSLFPTYLFVHVDIRTPDYFQVVWCKGVKRLVCFGGEPAPVDDRIIDYLKGQVNEQGLILARSKLKKNDQVQISKGPFAGLVGIIQEPPDNKSRVKVLLAVLSRQVQVDIPAACVDAGWIAPGLIT